MLVLGRVLRFGTLYQISPTPNPSNRRKESSVRDPSETLSLEKALNDGMHLQPKSEAVYDLRPISESRALERLGYGQD